MTEPSMKPTPVRQVRRSQSPLTHGTLVLVADAQKALLMENVGDAERPVLEVRREEAHDNPPTSAQGTDRPGRRSDGLSGHRSAMEETDWHRLEETRFADGLAEMLYARAHRARFQRLILAASPRVLGELRRVLHKEVSDRVVGEVPLTLTNHPVNEMAHRIADALTPPEAE
jgi:protein required for attachment to host cells